MATPRKRRGRTSAAQMAWMSEPMPSSAVDVTRVINSLFARGATCSSETIFGFHFPASLHRRAEQLLTHQLVERIEEQRFEGHVAGNLAVRPFEVFAVDAKSICSRAAVSQV